MAAHVHGQRRVMDEHDWCPGLEVAGRPFDCARFLGGCSGVWRCRQCKQKWEQGYSEYTGDDWGRRRKGKVVQQRWPDSWICRCIRRYGVGELHVMVSEGLGFGKSSWHYEAQFVFPELIVARVIGAMV